MTRPKQKPGRKPALDMSSPPIRRNLVLDSNAVEFLLSYGNGNLSYGLRRACRKLQEIESQSGCGG